MALISRCLGFLSYTNGLLATGLKFVLVPMAELQHDNGIQSHLEDKTKQGPHKISRISQIFRQSKIQKWYRELKPECLIQRRCFLGWAERANLVIGTAQYRAKFEWLGAAKAPATLPVKTHAFTFSVSAMNWVTAQGSQERVPTSMKTSLSLSHQRDLFDILESSAENLAILYDNTAKLGWCLPKASVVLHIAHTILSMRKYQLYDHDQLVDAEDRSVFANANPDGAASACLALKACCELTIRKGQNSKGVPIETKFSEIIEAI
jgi:hypothetical protein